MATHSSVLAWRIPGTGEPGGLPSMGSHRVGHDWSDLAAAAARHCTKQGGKDEVGLPTWKGFKWDQKTTLPKSWLHNVHLSCLSCLLGHINLFWSCCIFEDQYWVWAGSAGGGYLEPAQLALSSGASVPRYNCNLLRHHCTAMNFYVHISGRKRMGPEWVKSMGDLVKT